MDRIYIRRLSLDCIVGVYPDERRTKQEVHTTITLHCDLQSAGQSDQLDDTVDYAALMQKITAEVEESRYHLLEALAERVASVCLADKRVRAVDVTVEKAKALPASVAVEIHRSSDGP
ncbi:dihydroneopterin aldolase [Verrucomicrobiota bacterium]